MKALERAGRAGLIISLALAAASCTDLLLHDPASGGPAGIAVHALFAGGPEAQDIAPVLAQADQIRATFAALEERLVVETAPFSFSNGEGRARIAVDLDEPSKLVSVLIEVLADGERLFAAGLPEVLLTQGETTRVTPTIDPEVGSVEIVSVSPSATVTALGNEVTVQARALFATGHVIEDADLTFTSLDPEVLSRVGGASSGRFRAESEGTAEVRVNATAGSFELDQDGKEATVTITVAAEAVELEPDPASMTIQLGATATLQVVARDANGRALQRTIAFTSTAPGVASVASTGGGSAEVTGQAEGDADIVASLGDLSVSVPVVVVDDATPPTISNLQTQIDQGNQACVDAGHDFLLTGSVDYFDAEGLGGGSVLNIHFSDVFDRQGTLQYPAENPSTTGTIGFSFCDSFGNETQFEAQLVDEDGLASNTISFSASSGAAAPARATGPGANPPPAVASVAGGTRR